MATHSVCVLGLSLALFGAGCDTEADLLSLANLHPVSTIAPQNPSDTATQYRSDQGRSLRGLSGASFVTIGARISYSPVEDLELDGAQLVGHIGTRQLSGADFIGAQLEVRDDSGEVDGVEITGVDVDATDPSGATSLYTLQYVNAQTGAKQNVCLPDSTGMAKALPLLGSWDQTGAHVDSASEITFSCTSGVLAKCVRWGYRPWQKVHGVSLSPYHQACTRMARADYCGNGVSHTKDGTTIEIYDNLSVRKKRPDSPMYFEAAWTPDGAYCISKERWLNVSKLFSPVCPGQFERTLQRSPQDPSDLCLSRSQTLQKSDVLLSDRSYLQLTTEE
jgi:hypothetical protein